MKTCKICNKQFVRPRNLRRHQEKVHDKIKWKCQVCSKEFGRAESLKRHQASHERNDMHLLGDRFTTQRFLLAAGEVGDILPWSSSENVMLIAPSAVCGITIPRSWSRAMACRLLHVTPESLRQAGAETAPTAQRIHTELTALIAHTWEEVENTDDGFEELEVNGEEDLAPAEAGVSQPVGESVGSGVNDRTGTVGQVVLDQSIDSLGSLLDFSFGSLTQGVGPCWESSQGEMSCSPVSGQGRQGTDERREVNIWEDEIVIDSFDDEL